MQQHCNKLCPQDGLNVNFFIGPTLINMSRPLSVIKTSKRLHNQDSSVHVRINKLSLQR